MGRPSTGGPWAERVAGVWLEEMQVGFYPYERVKVGATDVELTRLGFGSAEIGGLYRAVPEEQAALLMTHAWDSGVRYFDSAPLYGYGTAEIRVGNGLRAHGRDEYTLSTKVGRLLVPIEPADAPAPGQLNHTRRTSSSGTSHRCGSNTTTRGTGCCGRSRTA